jgi:hypothetical protein
MSWRWRVTAALTAVAIFSLPAESQVLTFEGIPLTNATTAPIENWYDGGAGPNFGIDFSPNAFVLCLNTAGFHCGQSATSRGGLGDPNSQTRGLIFAPSWPENWINDNAGFTNGFSFFYTDPGTPVGSFQVFAGLNGTGALLASVTLGITPSTCPPEFFAPFFCPFIPAGVDFAGTAHSVVFSGANDASVIDDVTFGSDTPGTTTTPEPASIVLVATGLCGVAIVARRRRKSALA